MTAPAKAARPWLLMVATIVGPGLILAILVWQLGKLDPARWCGVANGSAKVAGTANIEAAKACFQLMSEMLGIYRQNTMGLIVITGISVVSAVVTALGAKVDLSLLGMHGKIGGRDDLPPTPPPGETGQ